MLSKQVNVEGLDLSKPKNQKNLKRTLSHIKMDMLPSKILTLRSNNDIDALKKLQEGLKVLETLKAIDIRYGKNINQGNISKLLELIEKKIGEIKKEVADKTTQFNNQITNLEGFREEIVDQELADLYESKNSYIIQPSKTTGEYTLYTRIENSIEELTLRPSKDFSKLELIKPELDHENLSSITKLDGTLKVYHNIDRLALDLRKPGQEYGL